MFATQANLDSDHDRFPAGTAVDALGKRLTRRSSPVALRAPSDERRRPASYTTPRDASALSLSARRTIFIPGRHFVICPAVRDGGTISTVMSAPRRAPRFRYLSAVLGFYRLRVGK